MALFTRKDKKREIHLLPQAARKKRKVTKEKQRSLFKNHFQKSSNNFVFDFSLASWRALVNFYILKQN